MSTRSQRIISFSLAVVFFLSSVGIVAYYVLASNQDEAQQQVIKDVTNQQNENSKEGTPMENFTPVATITELKTEDIVVGTGNEVNAGDSVTVHYTGATAKDGKIFQTTADRGEPVQLSLNSVIEGWKQGIPGMKAGGKRRIYIPSAMAYGAQEQPGIPANSDLVFDVEMVKIGN